MKIFPVPAMSIKPSTGTHYPPPFAKKVKGRIKRKLGDYFGLTHFGVNLTILNPGAVSALMHDHLKQDELVYVLEGSPVLRLESSEYILKPGDCCGFRAGNGMAAQFGNRTDKPVVILEIGDRSTGDIVNYPEDDLRASQDETGSWHFSRKNGQAYR